MMKSLMMCGAAAALFALTPPAFAQGAPAGQPAGCHRVTVDLKVVDAIWEGCNFKWWGGKFVPGNNPGGGSAWVAPPVEQKYCHRWTWTWDD